MSEYVALTMVSMMRGVVSADGTATAPHLRWGCRWRARPALSTTTRTSGFIGYTPTYVTGVWMGYPVARKTSATDMTGGHGALPDLY